MKKSSIISALTATFIFSYGFAYSAIIVESIKGDAAIKAGNQWTPLQQGQTLAEGSKISTGANSTAVLKIDGSTLTVRPLTMMKIFKNSANKGIGTHIGLKYGSLNAKVRRIGELKTNFKISTPVATSSVRGTEENVSYGPALGMTIEVIEGTVEGETNNGQESTMSGNQVFNMDSNDAKPDNLLSDAHDSALQPLYDPNNIDEAPAQDFVSDDIVGSGDTGAMDIVNDFDNIPATPETPAPTTTNVNIGVIWP